jgi:hypothetical protein
MCKRFASLCVGPPGATQGAGFQLDVSSQPWALGLGTAHKRSPQEHQLSHVLWPSVIRGGALCTLQHWGDRKQQGGRYASQ